MNQTQPPGHLPRTYATLIRDRRPSAMARIIGSPAHASLRGEVEFYVTPLGILVSAEVRGLPHRVAGRPHVFGFHIHEGGLCSGDAGDPFANAGGHYNPTRVPHPWHAGDLPPLFGNDGYAWMAVLTNRFRLSDILGRTVIVHDSPDDFVSQPAGNAGERIGCGVIYPMAPGR